MVIYYINIFSQDNISSLLILVSLKHRRSILRIDAIDFVPGSFISSGTVRWMFTAFRQELIHRQRKN